MEENNLIVQNELSNEDIKKLIYTIRGKQVMLDSDVAMLYHYETKNIFFDGQIWDSYSLIIDIIKKANNKILIIDNYTESKIRKL